MKHTTTTTYTSQTDWSQEKVGCIKKTYPNTESCQLSYGIVHKNN